MNLKESEICVLLQIEGRCTRMWKLQRDKAAGNCTEDLRASSRKEDQTANQNI
jgi:hypothetical protein